MTRADSSLVLPAGLGRCIGPLLPPGVSPLGLDARRDALVRCPPAMGAPTPLLVLLHGAGGTARQALDLVGDRPVAAVLAMLAPPSRAPTWDVITGGWGPDVVFIGRALQSVAARWPVDPARVAIAGFSDGASYALSLGLANGGLFGSILAFSPGFVAPAPARGRPRVFVSHGTGDGVLPIGPCSRRIVPMLRRAGYEVRYREFDGGHTVPAHIADDALAWAFDDGPPSVRN